MVLLLVVFRLRRPDSRSSVVRASDGLLDHLQLLFIPAGVGVIQHLPLISGSWLPIVAGLLIAWAATLAATAGAGAASLRLQARLTQRGAARPAAE
ncbi:MAG: hypothetical protein AVDCRST_MAG75-1782 [uncultured Propionibacteriaceae bacterium]|uniref:CidA/LrgA family protein n=1 Tax=uncultured Propionibacteriaceae bacterium TaxID=257457 RepID=A0A6J4NRM3_9ACTN|nr:MAG: hypothetical protein AVDCRST_MAG75-1782 [uncultured Propionibacteriaceae bacterium]